MTKLEKIQVSWQEAGFIWDEIKLLVDVNGMLGLLDLKHQKKTLTGYKMAYEKCLIKGIGFKGKTFMVSLDSLEGIYNNNGWTKIVSEMDLPSEGCLIQVTDILNKKSNDAHCYKPGDFEYIISKWTHYRIINNPKPLY